MSQIFLQLSSNVSSLVQFVCIAQQDYCCILNQVEKNMQKVEEEGEIVMVKEHRELDRTGTRKGHIVIKVTKENFHTQILKPHQDENVAS